MRSQPTAPSSVSAASVAKRQRMRQMIIVGVSVVLFFVLYLRFQSSNLKNGHVKVIHLNKNDRTRRTLLNEIMKMEVRTDNDIENEEERSYKLEDNTSDSTKEDVEEKTLRTNIAMHRRVLGELEGRLKGLENALEQAKAEHDKTEVKIEEKEEEILKEEIRKEDAIVKQEEKVVDVIEREEKNAGHNTDTVPLDHKEVVKEIEQGKKINKAQDEKKDNRPKQGDHQKNGKDEIVHMSLFWSEEKHDWLVLGQKDGSKQLMSVTDAWGKTPNKMLPEKPKDFKSTVRCYRSPKPNKKNEMEFVGCDPTFLLFASSKSGTTSLYHYMSKHPEIYKARAKELWFFAPKGKGKNSLHYAAAFPNVEAPKTNEDTSVFGPNSYRDCSEDVQKDFEAYEVETRVQTGEGTPNYIYMSSPFNQKQIYEMEPQMRLIGSFRNPIERAMSSYYMWTVENHKKLPPFPDMVRGEMAAVNECIEVNEGTPLAGTTRYVPEISNKHWEQHGKRGNHPCQGRLANGASAGLLFVSKGIYVDYIAKWLEYWERSDLHVIKFEDMAADTEKEMLRLTRFLGVSDFDWKPHVQVALHQADCFINKNKHGCEKNKSDPKPENAQMTPELRAEMVEFYRSHNERFALLTGVNVDDWNQ